MITLITYDTIKDNKVLSVNISDNTCLVIIVYNMCGLTTDKLLGLGQPRMCYTHAAWIYLQEGDERTAVDGLRWVSEVTRIRPW